MSKGSQVVCNKEMVLDVATKGIKWIKEYRIREKESYISAVMERKTWFGFGRNYTREEAIEWLKGDSWNDYHWIKNHYSESESNFHQLIGAIEICSNGSNILLSTKDANMISNWRDK